MGQSITGSAMPGAAERRDEQRFARLFERHKRHVAYVLLAVLVLIGAYWFYLKSQALKEQHAEAQYRQALQSAAAGNIPLAQSDLKKVVARYSGTDGGAQAAMALAKLDYQQGKWQDGITAVRGAANNKTDLQFEATMLLGAGYEGLQQAAQAARAYEQAAAVARFPSDRDGARAMAARAFETAGNRTEAVRIWTDLARDPQSGYGGEARVRLGELQAQPVRG